MKVIDVNGREVQPGDEITSFRGEKGTLVEPVVARTTGKSGKVLVQWSNRPGERPWTYYDNVFSLTVTEDLPLLPCGYPAQVVADEGHQSGCSEDRP